MQTECGSSYYKETQRRQNKANVERIIEEVQIKLNSHTVIYQENKPTAFNMICNP